MARKPTLADDLEDDFALDNDYVSSSDTETTLSVNLEPPANSKKRKAQTPPPPPPPATTTNKSNGKRSKTSKFSVPHEPAEQAELWNKFMKKASTPGITDLELSDHLMDTRHIYQPPAGTLVWGSATCLEELAKTAVSTGKSKNKVMHGAPQVLVICSSALRVIDLVKRLRPVSKRGVLKLFSRHIKISDQQKTLKTTAVDIAVGTPNRILKLLTEDALKVNRLRLVVIDCWQDDKMRVVIDMDDTKKDLFAIWKDILLPASANPDYGFKFRLV